MGNVSPLMGAVVGGLLSALVSLVHLIPFPGLIFLSYFSMLPLFLVGLGIGLRPFCVASLLATLLVSLLGGGIAAGEFFLFSALCPGLLISRILLNRPMSSGGISWYPSSLILRDFTLLTAAMGVGAFGLYVLLMQSGEAQVLFQSLFTALDPHGHLRESREILLKLLPLVPGLFVFSWGVMVLINGAIAQGLLVRFQHNLRPSPSLEALTAPSSFVITFGVCILLSIVGVGYVDAFGKCGSIVFALPFFLIGLGIVHQRLHQTTYSTLWLTLFYVSLILLTWSILLIVLLGLLRPWIRK